jgi:hypothetical protein
MHDPRLESHAAIGLVIDDENAESVGRSRSSAQVAHHGFHEMRPARGVPEVVDPRRLRLDGGLWYSRRATREGTVGRDSDVPAHEDAERILDIPLERAAPDEPRALVEAECGHERRAGSGLEPEALQSVPPRLVDQVA